MRHVAGWLSILIPFIVAPCVSAQTKPVLIAMAHSFIEGRPKGQIDVATSEFKDVMKKTTGLDGNLSPALDAFGVAEKVNGKQFHFGIFHAHEFAWVQGKYTDLQPLMVAVNKQQAERVFVIVHKTNEAKSFADLAGKKVDLAVGANEPCRQFMKRRCEEAGKKAPAAFFAAIAKSESPNDALDDVARGKVDATIVNAASLEFYKEIKEAVFTKNLRVLEESEPFPPPVIVVRKDGVDAAILKQFTEGLLKAHTTPEGREMMKTWNIDAFEPTPKDYAKQLSESLKRYPVPATSK